MTDLDPMNDRCDWSELPRFMCPGKECEGTPWPGNLEAPAPPPEPRLVVAWSPKDDKHRETRDWNDGAPAPGKGTRCRWDRDTETHLLPSHLPTCTDRKCNGCEPCTHDDAGNPVVHCPIPRGKTRCTEHLDAAHPRVCPRCIGRVRNNLAHIERLTALMIDQAIVDGLDSTAAMHAGPAADPDRIERRTLLHVAATRGVNDPHAPAAERLAAWEADILDERHPAYVCRQWELIVRDLTGHPAPRYTANEVADVRLVGTEKPPALSTSISYLSWVLTDIAQDPAHDFAQMALELDQCCASLEAVLGASRSPERGAPCPTCEIEEPDKPAPRLTRRRAHWCEKPDCTREHDRSGARDTWVCPRNSEHWWREDAYQKWRAERTGKRSGRLGA